MKPPRARGSRAALAAALVAGSALTAAVVPVAQAQVEEETEGTDDIDSTGPNSPTYEEGPEDAEPEREEVDVLDQFAPPDEDFEEDGSADSGLGVLNAPAPETPRPPPATAPLPPASPNGLSPAPDAPSPAADRSLGRQPQAPERLLGDQPHRPELRPPAPGAREGPTGPHARPPAREGHAPTTPGRQPSLESPPLGPRSSGLGSPQPAQPLGNGESSTAAGRTAAVTYRVRRGDSLWSIAETQLGPATSDAEVARAVERLWQLNDVRIGTGDPDLVMPGTVLRLR